MFKIIILPIVCFLLFGCNSLKQLNVIKSGKVVQQEYLEQIPFVYRAGNPFVKATINGKNGWFLFDTGAPNILNQEFAKQLNLTTKATGSITDSGGNTVDGQRYVQLASTKLGNVEYHNMGAVVQNLNSSKVMECLGFDGIIGANLMRKSFWKIDYKNQIITLTNNIQNLNIDSSYKRLKFKTKISGTPLVDLKVNGKQITNLTFDTGSNGHISMPTYALKQWQKQQNIPTAVSYGISTYGANGKAKNDSIFYAAINHIVLGGLELNQQIVHFGKNKDTIGNAFLKNYNIVLDWESKIIYLQQISEYNYRSIQGFGFNVEFANDGFFVGSLFSNSKAKEFLQLGDEVLKVHQTDYKSMSNQTMCKRIVNQESEKTNVNEVELAIKRKNKIHQFKIKKETFLEAQTEQHHNH